VAGAAVCLTGAWLIRRSAHTRPTTPTAPRELARA